MSAATATTSSVEPTAVGDIDERGYLAGFTRRGFTPAKALLELFANSTDALEKAGKGADGWIRWERTPTAIYMKDNGIGMDEEGVRKMFSLHHENHAADHSRGVSGVGAKPSLSILSQQKPVVIFTQKAGGTPLRVDVPWDEIHSSGRYTGKVLYRPMTTVEREEFYRDGLDSGTTIQFPNNSLLKRAIEQNLDKTSDPMDRVPIVFGRDPYTTTYTDFESTTGAVVFPKYDYFNADDFKFYRGVQRETIDVYRNSSNAFRYIWTDDEKQMEIVLAGSGYSKEPKETTEGFHGWAPVGKVNILTGLRRDPTIFDEDSPVLPRGAASHTTSKVGVADARPPARDSLTADMVGSSSAGPISEFNIRTKLVRNGQTIGTIQLPDVSESSARASAESYLRMRLVQCEMRYNPLSSHRDNYMDLIMGIQENKNQHNGDALPIQLLRLMRAIRDKKGRTIWKYFETKVANSTDSASVSDDSASTTSSGSATRPAPAIVRPTVAATGGARATPALTVPQAPSLPVISIPSVPTATAVADTIVLSPPNGISGKELHSALTALLSRIDTSKTYGSEYAPLLEMVRGL